MCSLQAVSKLETQIVWLANIFLFYQFIYKKCSFTEISVYCETSEKLKKQLKIYDRNIDKRHRIWQCHATFGTIHERSIGKIQMKWISLCDYYVTD